MKTKEELVNTYIKYSSDITEEIFNKIIDKLESLGFKKYSESSRDREYEYFVGAFPYLRIDSKDWLVGTFEVDYKEIQVSDILGEESQFEVGKYYFYNWDWRDSGKFICKIEKVSDNYIHCEWEYDIENKEFDDASGIATRLDEISEVKELTQEEIQQYLPDNHPDKIGKPIEKWSVGSYGVVIQSNDNNFPLGTIDKIVENRGIRISFEKFLSYKPNDLNYAYGMEFKWFATLPEAEVFSKSLLEPEEPKPLTINDLVEGEIYYCKGGMSHIFKYETGNDIVSESKFLKDNKLNINNCGGLRLATPEEKKWLLTCIKQDEFIPQDQLDMYDSEGNLIENKPKFKIGDYVITNRYSSCYNGRILRITKFSDRYPDIAYFEVFDDGYYSKNDNFSLDKVERFATPEEIAKVTKPEPKPFEFNKWYKRIEPECSEILIFVYDDGYYGFDFDGKWFNRSYFDYNESGKERLIPATIEEVKERLLSYAKEKYPIGTKFKCMAYDKEFTVTNPNYMDNANGFKPNDNSAIWIGVKEQRSGKIFDDKGKWAEVISKPESKESKEFDRKWYVEVSSQEEADKVFDWLRSQGEIANNNSPRRFGEYWNIRYFKDIPFPEWDFGYVNPDILVKKQLSDILPNYSKVNRNVYYEVSNQEEYEEILGWLKSMGEKVCTGSTVTKVWKYICKSGAWYLNMVKPDLPKAEFQFKGKSEKQSKIGDVRGSNIGMWEQMKPENIFPVENFEIRLTELKQEPRVKLINVPKI